MPVALITSNGSAVQASAAPLKNQIPILDNAGTLNLPSAAIAGAALVGAHAWGVITLTTSITLAYATYSTVRINAAGGSLTETLPAAAAVPGWILHFKRIDSSGNTVTLQANGAETIDGANTNTSLSSQYAKLTIQSNGVSWDII